MARSRSGWGLLALCLGWLPGGRALATPVSWDQLPGLVEVAPATKAEAAEVRAAEARTGYFGRSLQPRIEAGAFGVVRSFADPEGVLEPIDRRTTGAETEGSVSLNLWRAGRDRARNSSLNELASSQRAQAAQARADRLLAARRAWLEGWLQQGATELLTATIALTRADRERANRKAERGLTTTTDVTEFDLRVLALEHQAAETGERLRSATAELAALLGLSGDNVTLGQPPVDHPPVPEAPASVGLTELSLSGTGRSLASESRSVGAWPYPEIGVSGTAGQGGDWRGFPAEQVVSGRLGLTLSLWDGGSARVERRALAEQAEALNHSAAGAAAGRQAHLGLIAYQLQLWQERLPKLDERVNLAETFRKNVSEEYLRGVKDSRDLEDATGQVFEAGRTRLEVRIRSWNAWATWQALNARE